MNTSGGASIRWIGKKTNHSIVADGLVALYPRLWRFCLVLTRDRATADDLAQATAERGLSQAEKFEPGTDLDRWLFTLARRLWLNDRRAAKVRLGEGHIAVHDSDVPDHNPPVEVNILAGQVLDMVQALPDGQRLAVLLVYVEGYTYRETAETLDIPIGTVMSRLSAARTKIADVMAQSKETT